MKIKFKKDYSSLDALTNPIYTDISLVLVLRN